MKNSNKKSRKYLIALLIIFLLALAIGYAAFSDTLQISGTANAKGEFDLYFSSAVKDKEVGVDSEGTTISIGADEDADAEDKVTVAVKDLSYPGAGAQFTVVITNRGTIPAKLNSVTPSGLDNTNPNIKILGLDAISTSHPTIPAGGTCSVTFTVEWDKDSTTPLTDEEKSGVEFTLDLDYTQDTDATLDGSQNHTDTPAQGS